MLIFGGLRVAHLFSVLCCPIMCLYLQLFVGGRMSYLRYQQAGNRMHMTSNLNTFGDSTTHPHFRLTIFL
jgi:hypothetical protein